MVRTTSLYEACQELFTEYPLAARAADHSDAIRSMVLVLREDEDARFFLLSRDCGDGAARYSLCPWPGGDAVDIEADEGVPVPDVVAKAVTRGVPLPRRGRIFGWTRGDTITALVVVYTEYDAARPLPRWTVMPLASAPPSPEWPPFTGRRFFGSWFWEYSRAGGIVSLGGVIAASANTVFWVNTQAILGSDCCIVARDIGGPGRRTLQRGCYAFSEVLRAGKRVPSLAALLADTDKIDLAPRFRRSARSND